MLGAVNKGVPSSGRQGASFRLLAVGTAALLVTTGALAVLAYQGRSNDEPSREPVPAASFDSSTEPDLAMAPALTVGPAFTAFASASATAPPRLPLVKTHTPSIPSASASAAPSSTSPSLADDAGLTLDSRH